MECQGRGLAVVSSLMGHHPDDRGRFRLDGQSDAGQAFVSECGIMIPEIMLSESMKSY
jgi:hypothetical protein